MIIYYYYYYYYGTLVQTLERRQDDIVDFIFRFILFFSKTENRIENTN